MATTKVSKEEFSNLKAEIESYKNKNRLLELEKERRLIKEREKEEPFIILKKHDIPRIIEKKGKHIKKILNGGKKHQKVAEYIINILSINNFKYKTELAIHFKKIKRVYRLDILASKNERKIAIECGNTNKLKLQNLKKYFGVIHISYNDLNIIESAKRIENNIMNIIKNSNTEVEDGSS